MQGLLGSVQLALEKLSVFSTASCGGCQKEMHRHDPGLAHIFALQPLNEADAEAVRATQRGVRLLHEGRIEESLRELHDAKQLAPKSGEACNNLGCAYHMSGDDNSALYWYREAHRFAPKDETAVLALSLLEQRRGQIDEAQRLLVYFLQDVDPAHIGALKQLGKLHMYEDHWSKAAGCFHRLIAIDPTNNEWPAQLQVCLDQLPVKNERGEAVQSPAGAPGVFARAFSFAEPILRTSQADSKEAATVHGVVARERGSSGSTAQPGAADKLQESNSRPRNSQVGAQLEEAQRHRENGRTEAALGVYNTLLRQDCHNAEALLGLADCQYDLGNVDAALEVAKQLLGLKPDDAEANLRVAELLLGAGYDADMAEPYLRRAGSDPSARRNLQLRLHCAQATSALAREDNSKALAGASEAVRLDASDPRALNLLGNARIRVAEYPAALRALNASLDAIGSGSSSDSKRLRATAHSLSAQAHERLRQYPQALAEVQKALEASPQLSSARIVRAMALQQSGQSPEAEAELEAVLQRDPTNAWAQLQLGYAQLCRGDPCAANALESVVADAAGASRSELGAAKVYLALSIDAFPERDGPRHADMCVKEGLSLHRNLQHVWKEIEAGLANKPTAAVQRLRGICDLDLTSGQARQLLKVLARAMGSAALARTLAGQAGAGSQRQLGAASRGPSVPPNRWAPGVPSGACTPTAGDGRRNSLPPNRWAHQSGACTPVGEGGYGRTGPLGFTQDVGGRSGAATPLPSDGGGNRFRSASPAPWQLGGPGACRGRSSSPGRGGYPSGGYRGGSVEPEARGRRGSLGSREVSPLPTGTGDVMTIGWNELIRREQLIFGSQLGSGGSAQVYRGSWMGQEVAIKKISGVGHLEEMKKEVNALRRLRHPRLVRFIGACVEPPLLLVVTELMLGGSLHERIFSRNQSQPQLEVVQRWLIACHMAEGLAFLHSQRVVHRDMKSMNVLLDAQENAKICDFGLAQQMEATHIVRKLDGEGGSPRYMAPELYDAAHGKITEKVDIWAVGCILIELFGNVLPYADCSTMAQLSARILVDRRSPDVPPMVPPPLTALIRACTNFDPCKRLTGTDLIAELSKLRPR